MTTASANLQAMPLTLRLDPWTPAYESALQIENDAPDSGPVHAFAETDDWRVISPRAPDPPPDSIFFIDGVRRGHGTDHGCGNRSRGRLIA